MVNGERILEDGSVKKDKPQRSKLNSLPSGGYPLLIVVAFNLQPPNRLFVRQFSKISILSTSNRLLRLFLEFCDFGSCVGFSFGFLTLCTFG